MDFIIIGYMVILTFSVFGLSKRMHELEDDSSRLRSLIVQLNTDLREYGARAHHLSSVTTETLEAIKKVLEKS